MKIALVCPYDFAYPGGVANHICSLDSHLTRMGHEVKVIAPASKEITLFGDRFIGVGRPLPLPTSGSIARVAISFRLRPNVKDVLEEEKFDIIHLHEPLMPSLCTSVLRFSCTANVGTFHAFDGSPGYSLLKPLSTFLLNMLFPRLDGKIAVSKPAMQFVSKHFPGSYEIIPNGVDTEHFSPDVSPIDEFCDGKMNILFVGRLEKRKGADYLLKAYKLVKQGIPNSRLIIAGPGTRLRAKYEKQVEESGLRDVVFAGFVSYEDLPRYYKTADVFCTPAIGWESFGIILLEAMAVGTPIVASNIAGYASLITHGVEGLLVPPKGVRSLAQALISVLSDESLRQQMGANGITKAAEYDWKRVSRQVLDYYIKVRSEFTEREVRRKEVSLIPPKVKEILNRVSTQRSRI
ncbi:MAG: glycosyltransferase family 4 protein [Dehalococcoidia bacterium]|nr:MAG: glycosyltransferase family 4 protein [Dehalococcoidia bacterium]